MVNDTPIPHGTRKGYQRHKCRCDDCKAAQSQYARNEKKTKPDPSKVTHGTRAGYQTYRCRCEPCKAAQSEYFRNEKKRDPNNLPHGTPNGYKHYGCRCEECAPIGRAYARKFPKVVPNKPIPHGTMNGYANYKCRCGECQLALREYARMQYLGSDPDKILETSHRRRARMRDAFVENVPRREIFERDNWQCQIPGCLYPGIPASLDLPHRDPLYASVDHITPLSKGGKHERSNLACSHLRCNLVKSVRIEGIA